MLPCLVPKSIKYVKVYKRGGVEGGRDGGREGDREMNADHKVFSQVLIPMKPLKMTLIGYLKAPKL